MKLSDWKGEIFAGVALLSLAAGWGAFGADAVKAIREYPSVQELAQSNAILIQEMKKEKEADRQLREKDLELQKLREALHKAKDHPTNR